MFFCGRRSSRCGNTPHSVRKPACPPARWPRLLFALAILQLAFICKSYAQTATLVADTHVSSAQPTINSGTLTNLNVGNGFTSLLQFDLSTLPAGTTAAQVSHATLRFFCNRADTSGTVTLQPVLAAWGEYSVTYSSMPPLGAAISTLPVSNVGSFVTVDLTATVQGWVSQPSSNFGLALTSGSAVVQFDSKENDLTSHPATLEITLANQGPTGAAGAQGPTGPAGPNGAAGVQGPAGPQGVPGAQGVAGPQGPAGPQGQAGVQGQTGPQGPAGPATALSYQGIWSSLTTYAAQAVVTYAGSSYLSLTGGNRGNTPGLAASSWGLLAAAGQTGAVSGSGAGGLNYQGTWTTSTNYAPGDIAQYAGASYVSLAASNHGNNPSLVTTAWGLLAAAGSPGAAGATGATGALGPAGPPGLTGPAGPQGPSGPTGANGAQGTPGLVFRGAYASSTNYNLGDVVLWQGSSYSSLSPSNHGNTPDIVPAAWGLLTAQGPAGPAGVQGPLGPTGPQGQPGLVGAPGPAGPQGAGGPQGPAGAQGLAGPQGPKGDTGAAGPQGFAGSAGAQGVAGPAGPQGPLGPVGPQGAAGAPGLVWQGAYNSSTNYAAGDAVLWNGSGYLSRVASNAGNTPDQSPQQWSLFASAGAAGNAGTTGPMGPQGATGPAGATGAAGPQGAAGPAGPQGPPVANYTGNYSASTNYALNDAVSSGGSTYISLAAGNRGNIPGGASPQWAVLAAQGTAGPTGATGPQGPAGTTGPTGPAGATGPAGTQGPAGPTGAAGMNFRSAWAANLNYLVNDAVTYNGSSYIAVMSSTGVAPAGSSAWSLLAGSGAQGATGAAATVTIGTVTTGSPGTSASVTNSGSASAAVLNFTIPAGATGATGPAGSGGGSSPASVSGIPFVSTVHSVVFGTSYYAVNGSASATSEAGPVLTWVPNACTATQLVVYSLQAYPITVTLRLGRPSNMQNTTLSCTASNSTSCVAQGSISIAAGSFVDIGISGSGGTAASVWTALQCN